MMGFSRDVTYGGGRGVGISCGCYRRIFGGISGGWVDVTTTAPSNQSPPFRMKEGRKERKGKEGKGKEKEKEKERKGKGKEKERKRKEKKRKGRERKGNT